MALIDYSSIYSWRYVFVLFVSLIKLNGKYFAAKNVHSLSLVNLNSENLALKKFIFWVTKVWLPAFCVINQVKWRILRCKNCTLLVSCQCKRKFGLERLFIYWLTTVWLCAFCVPNQVKWRILCSKKCALPVTCQPNSENLPLKDCSSFDSSRYDFILFVSLIKLNG